MCIRDRFDTPEAIWNNEMRQFLIQKIAYHLADFTPRLKSNVKALYQYCPIPKVREIRLIFSLASCEIAKVRRFIYLFISYFHSGVLPSTGA